MVPKLIGNLKGAHNYGLVLVWRGDSKEWQLRRVKDFCEFIGRPDLVYTHYVELPPDIGDS